MATLFNASCIASAYPDLLDVLTAVSLQFDVETLDDSDARMKLMGPTNMLYSGQHLFTSDGVPYFNLNEGRLDNMGEAYCAKLNDTPAPPEATAGHTGEPAVAWLKLKTVADSTEDIQEVYRIGTAGGSPPATCADSPEDFIVEYAAQ